ncbi:MAG: hypothetical protein WBC53_09805 [Phycisphaerae bacterium]
MARKHGTFKFNGDEPLVTGPAGTTYLIQVNPGFLLLPLERAEVRLDLDLNLAFESGWYSP